MERPIYNLEVVLEGARLELHLNGAPLTVLESPNGGRFQQPLNHLLVGEGNELKVIARGMPVRFGIESRPGDIRVELRLKRLADGDIATPESGEVLESFDLFDPEQGPPPPFFPIERRFRFDTIGPAFVEPLSRGLAVEDEGALRAYALYLRDLFRAGDVARIVAEFAPKLRDYATAYYETPESMAEGFDQVLRERYLPAGVLTEFDGDDLALTRRCEGRLWQIGVEPDRPLVATGGNGEGGRYELPVLVGMTDQGFKVVR